jgi:hypothetical protein
MQTFAGLTLDTKRKSSPEESAPNVPSRSGLMAIQYLLNAFLVLNILQFLALVGLAHLDRRRKLAIAAATSIGTHGEVRPSDEFGPDTGTPKTEFAVDDGNEGSIRLPLAAREGPYPSTSSPEQTLPLLLSESERPYFVVQPRTYTPSPPPTIRSDTPRTKRIKRNELFAGLCFALIAFAWALFLETAWSRLRSKAERGMVGQS